jgi:5-methylcytosine-specific restriction endonuclease McrA
MSLVSDNRVWYFSIMHRLTKRALDAGDSAAFSSFFLASSFSCSQTESTPAPAPVTQTANKSKIWKLSDMDADHLAAWSKGGSTNINNCQMLCKTHNHAKGNR